MANLKKPNSVLYICFNSTTNSAASQLKEIAIGLEALGHEFVWVVRKENQLEEKEEWMTEGFEKRMKGKGTRMKNSCRQLCFSANMVVSTGDREVSLLVNFMSHGH